MADQPPPYPGANEKAGYPPQPQPYQPPPPQAGYAPPPQAGYGPPPPQGYGPPPPGAYPPPGQPGVQPTTVVVQQQPHVAVVMGFRESPMRTTCPHCRADVMTAIHYESGTLSWLLCVILCIIGCQLGCCLIPFCVEGCQDVIHTCPNCRQQIGRWSRM